MSFRRALPQVIPWTMLLVSPMLVFVALRTQPGMDHTTRVPEQHFYIVSVVAVVSAALALIAAVASLKLANVRVLLLTLSFLSMAGTFAVHGLATPGYIVMPEYPVAGFSARISVVVASAFLAASAVDWSPAVSGPIVRYRAAILGLAVAALAVFAVVALTWPESVPPRIMSEEIFLRGTLFLTLSFCVFAMSRYLRGYQLSRLPLYGAVTVASAFVFQAQISMHFGPIWNSSWWLYHFLLLAAQVAVLWGLLLEYARGSSPVLAMGELTLSDPIFQIRAGTTRLIRGLAAALEVRDGYTRGHGERVASLAMLMGERMHVPPARLRALAQGALLHDIGKIGVPDSVLHKPGRLDADEFDLVKQHPERGESVLASAGVGRIEQDVVRHHHERFDGKGYPDGLSGRDISLETRIVSVADVYDSIRSDRAYRKAWDRDQALAYMRDDNGRYFDPAVVAVFFTVVDRWESEFSADTERVVSDACATERDYVLGAPAA